MVPKLMQNPIVRLVPSFATVLFSCAALAACSAPRRSMDAATDSPVDAPADLADSTLSDTGPPPPSAAVFDPSANLADPATFYDLPFPSDLRLSASGTPDLAGFPHPSQATILTGLIDLAQARRRWPVLPVAYFRFTQALSPHDPTAVIAAAPTASVLLLDVDPTSPERGRLFPVVAATPPADTYLPANVLSVAARPGFVLTAGRTYAFVVTRALNDALARPLEVPAAITAMANGQAPTGPRGAALLALYAPLFDTLRMRNIPLDTVATATVFTTGDVVADLETLSDTVLQHFDANIANVSLAIGDSSTTHPRFCQINGTIDMPQFQQGTPPFDTQGDIALDAQGVPVPTTYPTLPTYAALPVVLTLPRSAMPAAGFPLAVYFHGSGGHSVAAVDRGTWAPQSATHPCGPDADVWNGVTGCFTLGEGPAFVHAARGLATAATALPVNPERLPGASETAYLNLNNLRAFPFTFTQGVFEQRLFIRALSRVVIPASVVAQCTGVQLPTGAAGARFDVTRLVAQGQSMGGMYTNLIAATEPTIRAAIPTGAGGYWSYFILQTRLVPGASGTLGLLLRTRAPLTFMHPALAILETGWEPAEPLVYMPRLARRPLPGHTPRPVYEPVGLDDSYFPPVVYDGAGLAYGHPQAGTTVWPSMQTALALDGLDGLRAYPVTTNLRSTDGSMYTGAVVQYAGDGVYDPHAIYAQLAAVKYQYSCFARSFVSTGVAVIPDPTGRAADAPCP